MDAAIHAALALAIRLAEKEYDEQRTYEAAQLVTAMRRAAGDAEVYEVWREQERKP